MENDLLIFRVCRCIILIFFFFVFWFTNLGNLLFSILGGTTHFFLITMRQILACVYNIVSLSKLLHIVVVNLAKWHPNRTFLPWQIARNEGNWSWKMDRGLFCVYSPRRTWLGLKTKIALRRYRSSIALERFTI